MADQLTPKYNAATMEKYQGSPPLNLVWIGYTVPTEIVRFLNLLTIIFFILFYYWRIKILMWNNKYLYLCFLLLFCFAGSSRGFLKMSRNIGSNFLKMTVETAKFLSNLSIFSLKSLRRLAISDHFFILLKNCIRLKNKIFIIVHLNQ